MMTCSWMIRFAESRSGSILMLFGLSILFLVGIAGAGYDLGRQQLVRQKIQQATDASTLAAAGMLLGTTAPNRTAMANRYFDLNYPTTYLGVPRPTPTITVGANDVTVSANAPVTTSFVANFGVNTLQAVGTTTAQLKKTSNMLDLILVMDNSNSMALSDVAATATTNAYLPWALSECVNEMSSTAQLTYFGFNYAPYCTATWAGPKATPTSFGWGMTGASRINALRYSADNAITLLLNPNKNNNQVATVRWDNTLVGFSNFSTDYNTVKTELLKMFAGGETDSSLGLAKAQALAATGFRAKAVHAIIFLTDGQNQLPKNPTKTTVQMNTQSLAICNAFKNAGTLVYTISFGGDINDPKYPLIRPFLSDCATGPNGPTYPNTGVYFFDAPNAAALQAAFTNIIGSLQSLKITN